MSRFLTQARTKVYFAISSASFVPGPIPAGVRLTHVFPEAFLRRFDSSFVSASIAKPCFIEAVVGERRTAVLADESQLSLFADSGRLFVHRKSTPFGAATLAGAILAQGLSLLVL